MDLLPVIFFSWQSDTSEKFDNRKFIRDCLDEAVKSTKEGAILEEAYRVDAGVEGLAGTPEVASAILDVPMVSAALRMAITRRRPPRGLIVHSDRGAQFASRAYRQLLAEHGLIASMSRRGNCYDNAFIESFWSSLKHETVYHRKFATRAEARTALFDYIESFYNRTRLSQSIWMCPAIQPRSKLLRMSIGQRGRWRLDG